MKLKAILVLSKQTIQSFTIFFTLSIILFTCTGKKQKSSDYDMNKNNRETSNSIESPYNPGLKWKLEWSDEFNTGTINTKNWNVQVEKAGRFNEEWQRYTNSNKNAYIENNCLVIKAIHEGSTHGINQYTSARLNTSQKQVFKHGKIAARIKLPQGKGIWPAFWMLGANIDENGGDTPWPMCGEIDILELYGSKDDASIEANIHYADSSESHAQMGAVKYQLDKGIFADAFHVFELEWDEKNMRWFVDGKEFATTVIDTKELSEFHNHFFILLNIAVGGKHAGRPDDSTIFPQMMHIDWIRYYRKIE